MTKILPQWWEFTKNPSLRNARRSTPSPLILQKHNLIGKLWNTDCEPITETNNLNVPQQKYALHVYICIRNSKNCKITKLGWVIEVSIHVNCYITKRCFNVTKFGYIFKLTCMCLVEVKILITWEINIHKRITIPNNIHDCRRFHFLK